MGWLIRNSVNHPRFVLFIVAVVSLAAAFGVPRVQLKLDARSLIPAGDSALAASDYASKAFSLSDGIVIGVVNESSGIYTRETLERIARLTDRLKSMKGVVAGSVMSLATTPRLFVEEGKIDTHPVLDSNARLDPQRVARIRREAEILGLDNGVLVARDGRAATIFAEVGAEADRYALLQDVREAIGEESTGEGSVYLSGTALAQAALGQSAALDLVKLLPVAGLVLIAVLSLAFKHLLPALISLFEIGLSLLWTVGLMGLTGQAVFITTLALPVIIIAIGVSDDVYVLSRYSDVMRKSTDSKAQDTIIEAFSHVSHSILLTTGTTAIGLLSLAVTLLQPPRVFGIYGTVAIIFSSLFTFTLVPALLVLLHSKLAAIRSRKHLAADNRALVKLGSLVASNPRRVLAIVLVTSAFSLMLATRLRVDDNWVNNLPGSSDIYKGDRSLNDLVAGTTTLDLMVDSGRGEGFLKPETFIALGGIEDAAAGLACVGAVHSIFTDVVRMNASLKGLGYSEYRRALKEGRLKVSREEIEQSILMAASARRSLVTGRIDEGLQRTRLTVFIRHANYRRIQEVLDSTSAAGLEISRSGGSIIPFGYGWISYLTVQLLVRGQVYSLVIALLIDLALLSVLLRSVRTAVIAIVPASFSVLIIFAVIALADVPLGIANSMFASIGIGIGLDFSIHLTSFLRKSSVEGLTRLDSCVRALVHTGPAIVTSAAAIAAGLSVLIFSEMTPNVQLGMMVCLGLLVCSAATLILVPTLVLMRRQEVV